MNRSELIAFFRFSEVLPSGKELAESLIGGVDGAQYCRQHMVLIAPNTEDVQRVLNSIDFQESQHNIPYIIVFEPGKNTLGMEPRLSDIHFMESLKDHLGIGDVTMLPIESPLQQETEEMQKRMIALALVSTVSGYARSLNIIQRIHDDVEIGFIGQNIATEKTYSTRLVHRNSRFGKTAVHRQRQSLRPKIPLGIHRDGRNKPPKQKLTLARASRRNGSRK